MRGEDLFRFGDVKREFGFHAATPDNLTALTTEQIDRVQSSWLLISAAGTVSR